MRLWPSWLLLLVCHPSLCDIHLAFGGEGPTVDVPILLSCYSLCLGFPIQCPQRRAILNASRLLGLPLEFIFHDMDECCICWILPVWVGLKWQIHANVLICQNLWILSSRLNHDRSGISTSLTVGHFWSMIQPTKQIFGNLLATPPSCSIKGRVSA